MLRIIISTKVAALLTDYGTSPGAHYTQTVQGWQGGNAS